MSKILVTGAAGFMGKHLYEELKRMNHEVIGTSRAKNEVLLKLDVTKAADFKNIPNDFDTLFHVAAFVPNNTMNIDRKKCFDVNAEGTKNVLEFCRKNNIRKIIYSSSASVYQRKPNTTEDMVDPINAYGESKLSGEKYCEEYNEKYGIEYTCLRYSTIYGSGEKSYSVLPIFVNKALKGESITVFGKGIRTQDFVYVKDVINANILAWKNGKGAYNISSGKETSMKELAEVVAKVFNGKKPNIIFVEREEDSSRFFLNISKARKEIGYNPKFSLEKGLIDFKQGGYQNENRNHC